MLPLFGVNAGLRPTPAWGVPSGRKSAGKSGVVPCSSTCSMRPAICARVGTLLVGSVRQLPICIGDTPALLLGPLTVEPPFRSRGVGRLLLERALKDAKAQGHRLVLLVGDEPYYSRVGFKQVAKGRVTMPGPVDYSRLLVIELVEGAFEGVSGPVVPDWSKTRT
jgi:predicted N-acetyltransferase YhbS